MVPYSVFNAPPNGSSEIFSILDSQEVGQGRGKGSFPRRGDGACGVADVLSGSSVVLRELGCRFTSLDDGDEIEAKERGRYLWPTGVERNRGVSGYLGRGREGIEASWNTEFRIRSWNDGLPCSIPVSPAQIFPISKLGTMHLSIPLPNCPRSSPTRDGSPGRRCERPPPVLPPLSTISPRGQQPS